MSKVVLMAWERMELYLNEHPDVARHIAANVTLFDEKKIEFLNAKIGRWFNPRTPNASIDDYTKVTSILKGVEEITRALTSSSCDARPRPRRATASAPRTYPLPGPRRTRSSTRPS